MPASGAHARLQHLAAAAVPQLSAHHYDQDTMCTGTLQPGILRSHYDLRSKSCARCASGLHAAHSLHGLHDCGTQERGVAVAAGLGAILRVGPARLQGAQPRGHALAHVCQVLHLRARAQLLQRLRACWVLCFSRM